MNKKAVLIDDENKSRTTLRSFLEKYCPTIDIVGEADGVKTGVDCIHQTQPDVVFLDIEMNDGTGFDLIEHVQDEDFQLIFVTAFNQYAIKAFRYSAIDYLLKPINPEELVQAVEKIVSTSRVDRIEKRLDALIANRNTIQKIVIPSMEGFRLEEVSNISYCESDNYYTNIHLKNGEKLVVSKTLKEYDTMLCEDGFFRIHQKYLVNVTEIAAYAKSDGGYVTLINGTALTVSRRKKEELMSLLTKK